MFGSGIEILSQTNPPWFIFGLLDRNSMHTQITVFSACRPLARAKQFNRQKAILKR